MNDCTPNAAGNPGDHRRVLVTGAAGFIGFHLARRLLDEGHSVVGLDNLNDYYDVRLKEDRLAMLTGREGFRFFRADIGDRDAVERVFASEPLDRVVHLAAFAGVRYSLQNPHVYVSTNVNGFLHILEGCRHNGIAHLLYASSSSVYGLNGSMPFSVHDNVDHPASLYAATKKADELMAHTYSHLFGLPTTGLRFFTVYGPWGRPDMALFLFTKAILEGRSINVFNHGDMERDFTYIDDIVEGLYRLLDAIPEGDPTWDGARPTPGRSLAPYALYNIGSGRPVPLMDYIGAIEKALGREAQKHFMPMQPGDIRASHADVSGLAARVGFHPDTPIQKGVDAFVAWYKEYYRVNG